MTKEEKDARIILNLAGVEECSVRQAWLLLYGQPFHLELLPRLSNEQCARLAKNYSYSYPDLRRSFPKPGKFPK